MRTWFQTLCKEEISLKRMLFLLSLVSFTYHLTAQNSPSLELDPSTAWATLAAYQIRLFPNPELHPLDPPGLVYYRVGNLDLRLDVITPGPETVVRPTVLAIHGGGWVHLTKDNQIFSLLPYLARGMDVVNVDYRQANQARAPAAVEDCRCALQWVFRHAKEYGFDTQRIVVAGGSAGGHLALMTGMLDEKAGFDDGCAFSIGREPVKVAAIVDLFGITDVAEYLAPLDQKLGEIDWPAEVHDHIQTVGDISSAVRNSAYEWFAGVPNRMELARRVSPLTYVHPNLPPILMVHGTADSGVPYEQSVRLHNALDKAGVSNELITILNGGHGVYPDSEKLRAQAAVFRFLEQHGVLSH
jgi:acetyl esterase/lipase